MVEDRKLAWNSVHCNASLLEVLGFFTATAKHKRVASLQSEDHGAFAGKLAQESMNLLLCAGVKPGLLPNINHARSRMDQL